MNMYYKYIVTQSLSSAFFSTVPLVVSIATFAAYVSDGTKLDVATALTALVLFDILRFPLFMLPNVINNIVEAKVSVDRVQSFLLEKEKQPVGQGSLKKPGVEIEKGTFVWTGGSGVGDEGGPVAKAGKTLARCLSLMPLKNSISARNLRRKLSSMTSCKFPKCFSKSFLSSVMHVAFVTAVAVAARGSLVMRARSPK